jgi:hypothetical protein
MHSLPALASRNGSYPALNPASYQNTFTRHPDAQPVPNLIQESNLARTQVMPAMQYLWPVIAWHEEIYGLH